MLTFNGLRAGELWIVCRAWAPSSSLSAFPFQYLYLFWLILTNTESETSRLGHQAAACQKPELDSIAVSIFVVILVEFDKYRI